MSSAETTSRTISDRDAAIWPALMRAAQDGDQHAYRRLLRAVSPYLRAAASRCLSDPHEIEDALQDILLAVHTARHTYDPNRPFRPWVAGIARYRLLDRLRGRYKISAREVSLALEHETFATPEPNTEVGALDGATLAAAVRSLPPGQRRAIELLKLRELSLKEAAAMTGMSIAALKVAAHRGLRSLRHALAGGAPE